MGFHVGQRVVCVNVSLGDFKNPIISAFYIESLDGIKRGEIYTISQVGYCTFHKHETVWLKEINRPADPFYPAGAPYAAARFRPLVSTDISIFHSILANPHKELETA